MSNTMRVAFALGLLLACIPVTFATAGTSSTLIVPVMLFMAWRLMKGIN